MKRFNRITGLILSALIIAAGIGATSSVAFADEPDTYQYKINFVTGDENIKFTETYGAVNCPDTAKVTVSSDNRVITVAMLSYLDSVSFDYQVAVGASSDKYKPIGIRKSGHDELSNVSFKVTEDETYVIAYGVKNVVEYYVQYVDESGNPLPGSEKATYYGEEGKQVYLPHKYYDGYEIKTDIEKGVEVKALETYTLVYKKTPGPSSTTVYTESTSTSYVTEVGDPEYTYQTIPGGGVAGNEGATTNRGQGGQAGGNEAGQAGGEAGEADDGTRIGEEQVPLGGGDGQEKVKIPEPEVAKVIDNKALFTQYVRYLIIIAVIGLLVAIITVIGTIKINYDKEHKN